jgi:hypothetical protein
MKSCPSFVELYPLHDKDGFIEFATGMWLHTTPIVGKPTREEVHATLTDFPYERRADIIQLLDRRRQLEPVNWAERLVA